MFRARGIEGILLNRALHKQHRAIYKWDRNTIWGVVGEEDVEDQASKEAQHKTENGTARSSRPDEAFARKFLEMTAYGTEGRIFTYVIMLDGEWRFTVRIGAVACHTALPDETYRKREKSSLFSS